MAEFENHFNEADRKGQTFPGRVHPGEKMKTFRSLILLAGLSAGPLFAGTQVTATFKSPGLKPNGPNIQLSLQGTRLRLDLKAFPVDGTLLYDRSTGLLTVVDHYAKSYEEFGAAKRYFMGKTLQVGLGVYESRLDKAPQQQRDAWAKLRNTVRAVFAADFQGPTGSVRLAGKTGARYESNTNAGQSLSLTVARPEDLALGQGEWETWKSFCGLLRDSLGGGLTFFGADPDKLVSWPGVPGFPLGADWTDGSQQPFDVRIETVKTKSLSDGTFAPPVGYQATSLMNLL